MKNMLFERNIPVSNHGQGLFNMELLENAANR